MAQVLAKIFQTKKHQSTSNPSKQHSKSTSRWHVPRFSKENINLIIFKDHTTKGRQHILDSRCVKKVLLQDLLCEKCIRQKIPTRRYVRQSSKDRCTKCPGIHANPASLPKYQNVCQSSKNDLSLIGEMVFGTAPLANSGTTLKVHSLRNPNQMLMLSLVFPFVKRCQDYTQSADFDELSLDPFESAVYGIPRKDSEANLNSVGSHHVGSMPISIRSSKDSGDWASENSFSLSVSSGSFQTPAPSPGTSSGITQSNKLCMIRRLRRSWNRSLQNEKQLAVTSAVADKNRKASSLRGDASTRTSSDGSERTQSLPEPTTSVIRKRATRIGLAVMFSLDEFDDSRREFESFFFSHITLIEGQLAQLRTAVEKSAASDSKEKVTLSIMEALERFQENVYDLYTAQRIPNPVWLTMVASPSNKTIICDKFLREFTLLIERYDTKSTNHFLSTVLTGVLMYHLAWVPTVMPSGEAQSCYADKHSPRWVDMLAKSHPYNPLWAQLSDMYGAIGFPPRLARTIVTGKKTDIIIKFLFVLTYFIRCSEIHETFYECYDEAYLLRQLESAADELGDGLDSLVSPETKREDEFVFVDPPNSAFLDAEATSDSGLVSESAQSKATRKLTDIASTTVADSESGFTELHTDESVSRSSLVNKVPSSSPADKVRAWINTTVPVPDQKSTIPKSQTTATLVSGDQTPCLSPCSSRIMESAVGPAESKVESLRALGRAATYRQPVQDVSNCVDAGKSNSGESSERTSSTLRVSLVRMFSSEADIDQFSEYFDGKPPMLNRQSSEFSNSQFDEYFDSDLDSLSQVYEPHSLDGLTTPTNTPGKRDILFKVMKEKGLHLSSNSLPSALCNQTTPTADTSIAEVVPCKETVSRYNSNSSSVLTPLPLSECEETRPRVLSIGKQSSRCSSPQTVRNYGETTPTTESQRVRHQSACPTILSDADDPYSSFSQISMPRSQSISRLADPAVSSFGRQQLAGFSDKYLSDFVLHGTADDDVIAKVQTDLRSSVEHSVLEDPISEAVCVVADTERWQVDVCTSMREQPKRLSASHLVTQMVETVIHLTKLKMSSEFILMHMEDRLQEMFFKSKMLAEYIQSRRKVDMDELGAMFGLEANDIRFLLSVASTHSTLNLHGIY